MHDFEDYLQAKLRIFANQGNDDVAVFNARRARARRQRPRRLRRRIAYCPAEPTPIAPSRSTEDVLFAGDASR